MNKINEMIEMMNTIEKDSEFPIDVRTLAVEVQVSLMKIKLLILEGNDKEI